ncbi:MAG: DUF4126 domain-containing protein [Magnetococcales bacterium]|uniref:DUF4126 domain-containing protein n=1 Tax=Candidatus Magnetobacterium casense TaxID=1455061 RepID=A0ABS6RYF6_9BACT|nr:DUF4126 domain-containing protein [Candidatus Magnetobacterium casensis]MBF0606513.1 DUF4126 domain-containing protein [Nitrospirota bacterium]MBV6341675.1 DUF4126 domain-containing protein [Candidatus Magnetobacterium casensis]
MDHRVLDIYSVEMLGSLLGVSFLVGIRLYATVLACGLGIRYGLIALPGHMSELNVLAQPPVLIVVGVLCVVEFLADKVPWVDSTWDSIHTIIRPVGAALLAMEAISGVKLDPILSLQIVLLCGGLSLSSHSVKSVVRLIVNHSPEPFSNFFVSAGEDVFVVGGLWIAIKHPVLTLSFVVIFMFVFIFFAPHMYRCLIIESSAIFALIKKFSGKVSKTPETLAQHDDSITGFVDYLHNKNLIKDNNVPFLHCISGKGVKIGRNYRGLLCMTGDKLIFVCKKGFRFNHTEIPMADIRDTRYKTGILFDTLSVYATHAMHFQLLKGHYDNTRISRFTSAVS